MASIPWPICTRRGLAWREDESPTGGLEGSLQGTGRGEVSIDVKSQGFPYVAIFWDSKGTPFWDIGSHVFFLQGTKNASGVFRPVFN